MTLPEHQNNVSRGTKLARGLSHPVCLCLLLVAVTLAIYWPVTRYDFLNYDDPDYVTSNPHVYRGLTFNNLAWAFTTSHAAYWHPLTWISHMLDCTLWGLNAGGHHLTNVLFHAANAVLLFLVLKAMTGALWRSVFVAALFACHPLDVESVAWVAQRKNVLSTFFWLLTLGAYLRYARRPGWRRQLPVIVCYLFGLMSKPMLVTLPCVLLLLDFWPLRRFTKCDFRTLWPLFREKLPLFLLAAASGFVTFLGQHSLGAVATFARSPLSVRLAKVSVNYATYLQKMAWPAELAVPYPYAPAVSIATAAACAVLVAGITLLVFWQISARPYLTIGWLWFVGPLVPVIGLVQVGGTPLADRFTYVPMMGVLMALTWGAAGLCANWRVPKPVIIFLALLSLGLCSLRARDQSRYWQNSETLFRHTLAVTKGDYISYNNLGEYLSSHGQVSEAVDCFQKSLAIRPSADTLCNLAGALVQLNDLDAAINNYQRALGIDPNHTSALYNLGNALTRRRRWDEAIGYYRRAWRIAPDQPDLLNNLGIALAARQQYAEAIACFESALKLNPDYGDAHNNLATILSSQKRFDEAGQHYREAMRLLPDNAQIRSGLADTLVQQGRIAEAVKYYQEALRLKPDDQNVRSRLQALGVQTSN